MSSSALRATRLTPLLAMLAAAACGAGEPDGSSEGSVSVTDSAGIVVMTQVLDPGRTLELTELWRIGSLDGDESVRFYQPRDAVVGDDDRVYVLDSGNHRIKVYAVEDGSFQYAFGSQGPGPGEFQQLAVRVNLADGILTVVDAGRRLHAFEPDGRHLETVSTGTVLPPGSVAWDVPVFDGEGWLLPVAQVFEAETRAMVQGQPTTLWTFDPSTGELGEPTELTWQAGSESVEVGSVGWQVTPVYHQQPVTRLDNRGRLYRVYGEDYGWEVWSADGSLLSRVTNTGDRVPVPEGDLARYEERERSRCRERPNSECELFLEEALPTVLGLPLPEFKPAVYQLDGTDEGDLLVLRADLGNDLVDGFQAKSYDLFAPDGRFRGRFTMPPTFRVIAMDQEHIVAVERDELDVESVVLYRWTEPGA